MKETVLEIIQSRVGELGFEKLKCALTEEDAKKLAVSFTACFRWLGKESFKPNDKELKSLEEIHSEVDFNLWRLDDLGRLLILNKGLSQNSNFIEELEKYFDLQEAISVSRCLPLLENPEKFVELAQEHCRTNTEALFQAMAWGNPYAYLYFDDLAYNQMILKALFMGVSLKPILGLEKRMNPELVRMARDYQAELNAAGRALSDDFNLILNAQKGTA